MTDFTPHFEPEDGVIYSIVDVVKDVEIATADDFGGAVLAYITIIDEDGRKLRVIDSRNRDVTIEVGEAAIRKVIDGAGTERPLGFLGEKWSPGAYLPNGDTPHGRAPMHSHAERGEMAVWPGSPGDLEVGL